MPLAQALASFAERSDFVAFDHELAKDLADAFDMKRSSALELDRAIFIAS
jgi:hypothetical protein